MRIKPWKNAAKQGPVLKAGMQELATRYDIIGDVRGEGLMCALELVSDRQTKAPVGKTVPLVFQQAAYEAGVMVRVSANNVILSPPLIVDDSHVATMLGALEAGLKAATAA